MQLPDKNVRPIGFFESPYSSLPKGRSILQYFRKSMLPKSEFEEWMDLCVIILSDGKIY